MRLPRFVHALPVVLVLVVYALPVSAKDKWINVTSRNFNIVSNANEKETTALAQKLEQFRFVFSKLFDTRAADRLPVTVMVFKDDKSFTPFKPLYNGKPKRIGGYFQPGEDEHTIALNIDANEQRPMSVIFHEYTHLLTSYSPRRWPIWLGEGIAELYSTFDVKGRDVTLGIPISHHVFLLRDKKFLPFKTLFDVRHGSPEYNEREKQGILYAQCWALAHYLMFGDKSVRQPQLNRFLSYLMAGEDVEKAFTAAFKTGYEAMEKALRNYIGGNNYAIVIYTLPSTQGEKEISVRPLSDAEAQFYLGNLLLRTNRIDEAEPYFKKALELDSELARGYEGLGFVAFRRRQLAEAREHFKQATARDSKNYLAHYYYAETLQSDRTEGISGGLKPDVVKTITDELKATIKLMPSFPRSYYRLAFLSLVTGENLDEGLQMIGNALKLEPQNKHFALVLAQLQLRKQDYVAAKKTLEPLLTADDELGVKSSALSMMTHIDSYTRRLEEERANADRPSAPTSVSDEIAEPPQLKRRSDEVATESVPAQANLRISPNAHPTLKLEGVETIGAVLQAIECGQGMVLVVKTPDRLIRFCVSDTANLAFFSQNPDAKINVGCGPINLPAFVYFKKIGEPSTFAGDAVAVEFAK